MNQPFTTRSGRLLLRVPEVAQTLGLGKTKVEQLIATGVLPAVRIGKCVRISAKTLEKWIEQQEQASS